MELLAGQFRWCRDTISQTIDRTCKAIWTLLISEFIPVPTCEQFLHQAEVFKNRWDMPNCVGAVDGKHIAISKPPRTGSLFYNYKGYFSIVLMAVADGDRFFQMVSVGAMGSQSDGGVFKKSEFGKRMLNGTLDLPPPAVLPGTNVLFPHYIIGDPAFQLSTNLMRSYPGTLLPEDEDYANNRMSRARMNIECAFGMS